MNLKCQSWGSQNPRIWITKILLVVLSHKYLNYELRNCRNNYSIIYGIIQKKKYRTLTWHFLGLFLDPWGSLGIILDCMGSIGCVTTFFSLGQWHFSQIINTLQATVNWMPFPPSNFLWLPFRVCYLWSLLYQCMTPLPMNLQMCLKLVTP